MHAWSTSESRLVWIRKHSSILFKSQVTALLLSALVLLILKTDRERKQGFLDFDINYYRRCFNQQLNTSLIGTCLFKSTCFAIFGAELCNHEIVTLQLTTKIYASILCKSIVLDCTLAKKKMEKICNTRILIVSVCYGHNTLALRDKRILTASGLVLKAESVRRCHSRTSKRS